MITVGRVNQNKEGYINIKIDRSTILGNPFPMKSESQRNEVCDKYEKYFAEEVKKKGPFRNEIIRIFLLAKEKNVNLQCWCAPKRCHGDTIKNFIESYIKQDRINNGLRP